MSRILNSSLSTVSLHIIAFFFLPSSVAAVDHGLRSITTEYQYVRTGEFDFGDGNSVDIGNTDAHVFVLSGEYALSDRLTVSASLPWISKRHKGAFAHNPFIDLAAIPEDATLIDDGTYHSDFQDLFIGLRYKWNVGGLTLQPMISYGVPTNEYPFYGHSAVGKQLWQVQLGSGFLYTPYFSDFFYAGAVRRVFIERQLGVDSDHWLIDAEVGYWLSSSLSVRLFINAKLGNNGLEFPEDYDAFPPLGDEKWYRHDQITKHNFVNGGVGMQWRFTKQYQLSISALRMIDPDQVNVIDFAGSFSITRYF